MEISGQLTAVCPVLRNYLIYSCTVYVEVAKFCASCSPSKSGFDLHTLGSLYKHTTYPRERIFFTRHTC